MHIVSSTEFFPLEVIVKVRVGYWFELTSDTQGHLWLRLIRIKREISDDALFAEVESNYNRKRFFVVREGDWCRLVPVFVFDTKYTTNIPFFQRCA